MLEPIFQFTIIVPFYETINYFEQTLQSLLEQKNINQGDIQILLINDGSKYDIKDQVMKFKNNGLNVEYHYKSNGN
jgi:glycosyltransferase involved in cell wall biosynthesis